MKVEKPIHYEPHPVSPERKAELIASGVQIIDAIYKPADEAEIPAVATTQPPAGMQFTESSTAAVAPVAPAVRRGRPPRA